MKIDFCDNVRYLEVLFDNKLRFESHVNKVVTKASQLSSELLCLTVQKPLACMLLKSFIESLCDTRLKAIARWFNLAQLRFISLYRSDRSTQRCSSLLDYHSNHFHRQTSHQLCKMLISRLFVSLQYNQCLQSHITTPAPRLCSH